jgi:hypothetical protein
MTCAKLLVSGIPVVMNLLIIRLAYPAKLVPALGTSHVVTSIGLLNNPRTPNTRKFLCRLLNFGSTCLPFAAQAALFFVSKSCSF